MSDFVPGLEGIVAFETEIAEPDKEGGSLRYRGVDIEELVGHVSYGHVWGLLVDNEFAPGLPPAEPYPIPVHSGDIRVDVQSALAMLAPAWGLRHGRSGPARRLRDDRERRGREPREIVARVFGADVDELAQAPLGAERGEAGLEIGHHRAARVLELDVLGHRHAGLEALVDEQAPDLLERVVPDELLDVDAAVTERRALLVRLGDLRLEGDHPFEPRAEVFHAANGSAGKWADAPVRSPPEWRTA